MADDTKAAPEAASPDLEQLRDDKCIPVARGLMVDMATDLVPDNANENVDFTPLLMKTMQRALDADLNIVMDNPYVFQLVLGAMSGLNATVQSCETTPVDDVRYGMIAKKILSILATANVPLVVLDPKVKPDPAKIETDFAGVKEQVQALISENNLSRIEVQYIMENIFTGFQSVQNAFMNVVADHAQKASAKLFGLDDYNDLSMKKLDDVLTEVK